MSGWRRRWRAVIRGITRVKNVPTSKPFRAARTYSRGMPKRIQALAQINKIGAAKALSQPLVVPAVGDKAVMLSDNHRKLRRPRPPARPLQPGILSANRRNEVVKRAEYIEVMKGRRDGQLVVAIIAIRHKHTREVQDPIDMTAITPVTLVVAASMIAVRVEDLLHQIMRADDRRHRHADIVRPLPAAAAVPADSERLSRRSPRARFRPRRQRRQRGHCARGVPTAVQQWDEQARRLAPNRAARSASAA